MQKAQIREKSSGGGAGGFGGGGATKKTKVAKKSKSYSYTARLDKDGFGSILINDGVARINNVLKKETVSDLRNYVDDVLEEEIAREAETTNSGSFARVLQPKNRWDLLLPLDTNDSVMKAMDELIGKENGSLNSILDSTVGEDGVLYELAALVSDPGSERQVIHPDIPFESEDSVSLVTCFFALQNIDETMGPTVYLPGTNTEYHHEKFNNRATADALLSETQSVLATLNAGDCSIYNPATLHCGSSNKSENRRAIFYFTFWNPTKDYPGTSNNPGSLRSELRTKPLTLKDLRKHISTWKANNT